MGVSIDCVCASRGMEVRFVVRGQVVPEEVTTKLSWGVEALHAHDFVLEVNVHKDDVGVKLFTVGLI